MPVSFCNLSFLINKILNWICLFLILAITTTKFMFICVWKSIRQLNDDLLSRFVLNLAVSLGLFFTLTVPRLNNPSRNQVTFWALKVFQIIILNSFILHYLRIRLSSHNPRITASGPYTFLQWIHTVQIESPNQNLLQWFTKKYVIWMKYHIS